MRFELTDRPPDRPTGVYMLSSCSLILRLRWMVGQNFSLLPLRSANVWKIYSALLFDECFSSSLLPGVRLSIRPMSRVTPCRYVHSIWHVRMHLKEEGFLRLTYLRNSFWLRGEGYRWRPDLILSFFCTEEKTPRRSFFNNAQILLDAELSINRQFC